MDWIVLDQDRERLRALVIAVTNILVPLNAVNILCSMKPVTFSRSVLHRGVRRKARIYLRTKSDLCHLWQKLIGFYNRDYKCLQRGTDWVFK